MRALPVRRALIGWFCLLLLWQPGCSSTSEPDWGSPIDEQVLTDGLVAYLYADREVARRREPLEVILRIRNFGRAPITLTFTGSSIAGLLTYHDGEIVSLEGSAHPYLPSFTDHTFPPGRDVVIRWSLLARDHHPTGPYRLVVRVVWLGGEVELQGALVVWD